MIYRTLLALLVATCLTACGGGEDVQDVADTTGIEAMSYEPPARGPEWLAAPQDEQPPEPV